MTSIEILDTAVKVGLGAVIAAGAAIALEIYRRRSEDSRRREERYRENIERPVVAFVDEMLVLMSKAYWDRADGKESDVGQLLEVFRQKEAMVEARLTSIRNPELSQAFRSLDSAYYAFRAQLAEGWPKARDIMKEADAHAAEFFRLLYPPPP